MSYGIPVRVPSMSAVSAISIWSMRHSGGKFGLTRNICRETDNVVNPVSASSEPTTSDKETKCRVTSPRGVPEMVMSDTATLAEMFPAVSSTVPANDTPAKSLGSRLPILILPASKSRVKSPGLSTGSANANEAKTSDNDADNNTIFFMGTLRVSSKLLTVSAHARRSDGQIRGGGSTDICAGRRFDRYPGRTGRHCRGGVQPVCVDRAAIGSQAVARHRPGNFSIRGAADLCGDPEVPPDRYKVSGRLDEDGNVGVERHTCLTGRVAIRQSNRLHRHRAVLGKLCVRRSVKAGGADAAAANSAAGPSRKTPFDGLNGAHGATVHHRRAKSLRAVEIDDRAVR